MNGRFDRFWARDCGTAFSMFTLKVSENVPERDSRWGTITVLAQVPDYDKNTPLRVTGEWMEMSKGRVLRADTVVEQGYDTASTIEYLMGIKGIGMTYATEIVDTYGPDCFTYLSGKDGVEKLLAICKNLSHAKATALCARIRFSAEERKLMDYVFRFGGTYKSVAKMFRLKGSEAIAELKKSPYNFGKECGLSFQICDAIALSEGLPVISKERVVTASITAIRESEKGGNCFTREKPFIERVQRLLKTDPCYFSGALIMDCIADEPQKFSVFPDYSGNGIYSKSMLMSENSIAIGISALQQTAVSLPYDEQLVDLVEQEIGVKYAEQQRDAFEVLRSTAPAIVTGGPGTGKTTVINGILRAYEHMCPGKVIACCAPTGRASQRMKESTGREAMTVHKLLDYRPYAGADANFRDSNHPIEADFIVVDESSMLDTELTAMLLNAVKKGTKVLFVGDVDQLQAVGPGDVLHNMIFSGSIDVRRLTAVYRQAADSPIVANARKINFGEKDLIQTEDFRIEYCDATEFPERTMAYVQKLHDPKDPFAVQVLSSVKLGDGGTVNLNRCLQEMLNPKSDRKAETRFGNRIYRQGDKVVMLHNDYAAGYHNGDIGTIVNVPDNDTLVIAIEGQEQLLHISGDKIDDVGLAYALTVHKSQGSEFRTVIMVLPYNEIMLKRNLIYTGVTRAKKDIIILAENQAVDKAIETDETGKRNTSLTAKLRLMC